MVPGESSRRSTASAAYLQRPLELQDSLNRYCYHPLAWRLAKRLAPAGHAQHGIGLRSLRRGGCRTILCPATMARRCADGPVAAYGLACDRRSGR